MVLPCQHEKHKERNEGGCQHGLANRTEAAGKDLRPVGSGMNVHHSFILLRIRSLQSFGFLAKSHNLFADWAGVLRQVLKKVSASVVREGADPGSNSERHRNSDGTG